MSHLYIVANRPQPMTCYIVPMYDPHDQRYPHCGFKAIVEGKEVAHNTHIEQLKVKVWELYPEAAHIDFKELFDEGEDL